MIGVTCFVLLVAGAVCAGIWARKVDFREGAEVLYLLMGVAIFLAVLMLLIEGGAAGGYSHDTVKLEIAHQELARAQSEGCGRCTYRALAEVTDLQQKIRFFETNPWVFPSLK